MGEDFTLSRTVVTFDFGEDDGNRRVTFVHVLDDPLVEGTESFTLSGSVTAPYASFVGDPVTIDIIDDDSKCVYSCSPAA